MLDECHTDDTVKLESTKFCTHGIPLFARCSKCVVDAVNEQRKQDIDWHLYGGRVK